MVIRLSREGDGNKYTGPQPGPEPAWARFARQQDRFRMQSYRPDRAAYHLLGGDPDEELMESIGSGEPAIGRNRFNSGVYVASLARMGQRPSPNSRRVPVVGEIAAGQYDVTVAFQEYDCLDYEGGVPVDRALAKDGAYALRVRGTSMTHVGIEPGDVVVVRPQSWADDGDFVVAAYTDGDAGGSEGLATLKRFYKRRDHVFLQSATASTDPIRLFPNRRDGAHDADPVRVQGVITMVLKAH